MEKIDWNALRDRAYKNACDHGFHDEKLSRETYFMLIITEISEAVEADRKGRKCDPIDFDHTLKGLNEPYFDKLFEAYVKDAIPDELADVIIRCLDLAGAYNCNIGGSHEYGLQYKFIRQICDIDYFHLRTFPQVAFDLCKVIIRISNLSLEPLDYSISKIISWVLNWCEYLGIDIMTHVHLKMKYNETRPYKNGKKY